MWKTYSETRKLLPDFVVVYEFFKANQGGREIPPFQGYRCDFSYEVDNAQTDGIFMIHPEFLDVNKKEILVDNIPVPIKGFAYMWIISSEMRKKVHLQRIKIGTKGYFMEGSRKVGKVEVCEIIGLNTNSEET